jgi:hypothetical protein
MLAGHFAVAAAVKAKNPEIPLWSLMLSTQLMDIAFAPLLVSGVETMEVGGGYGNVVIHADYTHSLVGALLLAAVAGAWAGRAWGKRAGYVIGATVFSHWILDLLVHRADLPLLPGNLGNLPLLGFGLWRFPAVSHTVEALLILVGGAIYFRSALARAEKHGTGSGRAVLAGSVTVVLMLLCQLLDALGIG